MISIPGLTQTSNLVRIALSLISLIRQLGVAADAVLLTGRTIGTSVTPIAHGQKGPPQAVFVIGNADARIWEPQAPDASNVFLQASSSVTVKLLVVKGGQ